MKYLLSQIFLAIFSFGFSYYLLNNSSFLPLDINKNINWMNVITLTISIGVGIFAIISLLTYIIISLFKKETTSEYRIKNSIKWGTILDIGLLLISYLHIFHVLDIVWGIPTLFAVLILLFVVI